MIHALSSGDLKEHLEYKGYICAQLKQFQANLRHLVWQVNNITQGNYGCHIDFMGGLGQAFNLMARKLAKDIRLLNTCNLKIQRLSEIDQLTGIHNRRFFTDFAGRILGEPESAGGSGSLILLDIDKFKEINDTLGHIAGDSVLQQFALNLDRTLRKSDLCARFGGDEFIIFLKLPPETGGVRVTERLRALVQATAFSAADHTLTITASFGITSINLGLPKKEIQAAINKAISEADVALYQAKRAGGNCVRMWEAGMTDQPLSTKQTGSRSIDAPSTGKEPLSSSNKTRFGEPKGL